MIEANNASRSSAERKFAHSNNFVSRIVRIYRFFSIICWITKYSIQNRISIAELSKLNPDIPNGGKGLMPKSYIYNLITKDNPVAKKYFAKTITIKAKESDGSGRFQKEAIRLLIAKGSRPVVMKPDIGARSIGVFVTTKESEREEILQVCKNSKYEYIAQEYVPYKHELSVFYYRYPSWKKGRILGIAEKKFVAIMGDGSASIQKLIKDRRINKSAHTHLLEHYRTLEYIPKKDEEIKLVSTVSHDSEGDYNDRPDLITRGLEKKINSIIGNKKIYFCRLDIRAETIPDFKNGRKFKVLEINTGPNAVLLHAFDPRYSAKKQSSIYKNGFTHAFEIVKELKALPRPNLIPYLWFLAKDEIPLFFLKYKLKRKIKINSNQDNFS